MAFDDNFRELAIDELQNANTDRSANPAVMVRGMMTKTSAGSWVYTGSDANYLRVSAVGITTTTSPLSADSSSISAIQGDAGKLRVSALGVSVTTSPLSADSSSISSKQGDAGLLHVSAFAQAIQDTNNTTFSLLSANQQFLGTGFDLDPYASWSLAIFSDKGSATNGMKVQWSTDNTNWNWVDQQTLSASVGNMITFGRKARYVRLSYDNGAAGQTAFSAVAYAQPFAVRQTRKFVGNVITDQDTGQVVVAGIQAHSTAGGGTWVDVKANASGALTVAADGSYISATIDNGSISAKSGDANQVHVSAVQGDAGLLNVSSHVDSADQFHVSAFSNAAAQLRVSAFQLDAGNTHVSAFVDSGSISAKSALAAQFLVSASQGDAGQLRISSVQGDAGLLHVSAIGTVTVSASTTFLVSAHEVKQSDASSLRVSAIVDSGSISAKSATATQFVVSAAQADAGVMRVSSSLFPDTTGGLTVFQTLSVSASQSVKGTAGALYGWYLYNTDTKPNYVKFFNVSGASNIGTDTPLLTICLPASAAANVEYPHGMKGFTNGINITATSGRPIDNTAAPAASSVGAVLFYV